ncbi:alpha-dextran endo-1%2C6-alpha-glucosidase [Clostridium baratii]|uniref:type I pullulanase n=1 Tax=Clostridium baratii TaxID=1561 RepID=UPI0006C49A8A|nr:type I pullulanase [Clostridium baratii]CUP49615.1 alpha-dextran endo-1%2C6-alpha-glucosidase [Clostridium baratii]
MKFNIKNIYKGNINEVKDIFNSKEFNERYTSNLELGAIYSKSKTTFRVWSPVSTKVTIELFNKDNKNEFNKLEELEMKEENNVWTVERLGDLNKIYYRLKVQINENINIITDPYSKAVSCNGEYSMVVNLEETNPKGWDEDFRPFIKSQVDSIIYEAHIRDFTIDNNLKENFKGKFKGFWQKGTTTKSGYKTGIDHLKELGITHIHLLPIFDFKTVNEEELNNKEYNWGYDPVHYNAIEGSYSLDPFNGEARIKEFKELVLNLHKEGIRVVMDVVYNHTYDTNDSIFNKLIPYYYYREDSNGNFSNGSGCGNELASEREMVRKFIVNSVCYYAKEYHIDGFRFDLMGLHDIKTMKIIREELNKIDKTIIMYGEGWIGSETPLNEADRSIKKNINKFNDMQIAAFNDDIRDGIKGNVFSSESYGFISGGYWFKEAIKSGIIAFTNHKDIDYSKVSYWANEPYQVINYSSSHDNYTLWDKLSLSCKEENDYELIKINKLAAVIVLTSQGIPFIHSGEELLRTKTDKDNNIIENSYNSSNYVNKIEWSRKEKYIDVFNYYKGLIALRRNHKIFRMSNARDILNNIKFINTNNESVIAYKITRNNIGDSFKECIVILNGGKDSILLNVDNDIWDVILDENSINEEGIRKIYGDNISVNGRSATIMVKR